MKDFWQKLKKKNKPFYCLAPMAGVTDSAFRQICKEYGADVVYSEMASVTALAYNPDPTLEMLRFNKKERPYVVQLFGSNPEHFAMAAKLITKKIKPDGLDINFGCPVKKVQKQGAGATLMGNMKSAKKAIEAVLDNTNLPVSIKCRTSAPDGRGGSVDVLRFLDYLKGLDIKAVMIHGRTMAQGHTGEVNAQIIKEARRHFKGVIIANGGVKDHVSAEALLKNSEADGLGIGQGAMGKPWIFEELKNKQANKQISRQVFKAALKHAKLVYKLKGKQGMSEMRKHLCWYVGGLPGAAELRRELVKIETLKDIEKILK